MIPIAIGMPIRFCSLVCLVSGPSQSTPRGEFPECQPLNESIKNPPEIQTFHRGLVDQRHRTPRTVDVVRPGSRLRSLLWRRRCPPRFCCDRHLHQAHRCRVNKSTSPARAFRPGGDPGPAVGEDHGFADKLGFGLLERAEDRGRTDLRSHAGAIGLRTGQPKTRRPYR
jgi:hypothetical protein